MNEWRPGLRAAAAALWIPSARWAIAPYRFVRFYRFMMCSARFSTFNAASLTASLKVGCE
jgi:hypothetical protein